MWTPAGVRGSHRVSYQEFVGEIPDGAVLDHTCHSADAACPGGPTCRHRRCFNPDHLEPTTHSVNVLRGRGTAAVNAVKTHCKSGHEFTPENTTHTARGTRRCRKCDQSYKRRVRGYLSPSTSGAPR